MPRKPIPGHGRKRPQLNIHIDRLFLDPLNPRLPQNAQGKSQEYLLSVLYKEFDLAELIESMSKNGYFDEEPLVAVPRDLSKMKKLKTKSAEAFEKLISRDDMSFTVVEGNRRLAAAKLIANVSLRKGLKIRRLPEVKDEIIDDLTVLPVIAYPKRDDVVPYLGVRHIVGIQKWDSYAKARYIASMTTQGYSINSLEAQVGDRSRSISKSYLAYKLLEQAQDEFSYDVEKATSDFSLLILSIGLGKIKRYLGIPRKYADVNFDIPVPLQQIDNLKNLLSWIYGDERYLPVIKESRDITNRLSAILESPEATAYLIKSRDLEESWERSGGEQQMVLRFLSLANRKLETVLGMIHRNKTPSVVSEIEKCKDTIERLCKEIEKSNDRDS